MNDRIIGTSVSTRNKVGRVVRVLGDRGKRKFVIALDNGGELALSKRSFRKFQNLKLQVSLAIGMQYLKLKIRLWLLE
jgi:hypothetical protein